MSIENVPVIDVTALASADASADAATLTELDNACRDWGFFQVVNHGIDEAVIEALKLKMQEFFLLPKLTKRSIGRTAENPWGYFDQELTKNTLDWKEVFDYGPAELPTDGSDPLIVPQWPRSVGVPIAVRHQRESGHVCRVARRWVPAPSHQLRAPELLPDMPPAIEPRACYRSGRGLSRC
jgi:isopenicillin N synthase-like dioxygenase